MGKVTNRRFFFFFFLREDYSLTVLLICFYLLTCKILLWKLVGEGKMVGLNNWVAFQAKPTDLLAQLQRQLLQGRFILLTQHMGRYYRLERSHRIGASTHCTLKSKLVQC